MLRRALVSGVIALVCAGCVVLIAWLPSVHHESLQREGARVEGTVLSIDDVNSKGDRASNPTMDVRYAVRGETFVETYYVPVDRAVAEGVKIEVVHDPDDPDDSAVADAPYDFPAWNLWLGIPLFLAFAGFGFGSLVGTVRWSIRLGPARTGWRTGRSRSVVEKPNDITITFDDGATTTLTLARPVSLAIPVSHQYGPVLIAGSGARTTVLFLSGPVLAAAWEHLTEDG